MATVFVSLARAVWQENIEFICKSRRAVEMRAEEWAQYVEDAITPHTAVTFSSDEIRILADCTDDSPRRDLNAILIRHGIAKIPGRFKKFSTALKLMALKILRAAPAAGAISNVSPRFFLGYVLNALVGLWRHVDQHLRHISLYVVNS